MSHRAFFKGMTVGLIAGAAIGATIMPTMHDHKCVKHKCTKKAGKFLKTAGEVIEHITGMFFS